MLVAQLVTDSRQRLIVIIVNSSKRGSFNNRGSRNASFGGLHITEGLAVAGLGASARNALEDAYTDVMNSYHLLSHHALLLIMAGTLTH